MPLVMCSYCHYLGEGKTLEEKWKDVQKHEVLEHPGEIEEEFDSEYLDMLKEELLG